jgi:Fic family protein
MDIYMRKVSIGTNQMQTVGFSAFVPNPFPPVDLWPFPDALVIKTMEAARLLGKLDGTIRSLPEIEAIVLMFLRKEAISSCQIEGIKATMQDVIESNIHSGSTIPEDVNYVLHYIEAMNNEEGFISIEKNQISIQVICDLHFKLFDGTRKINHVIPGEFRKSYVWIGGSRPSLASFVPPPINEMIHALEYLVQFINTEDSTPIPLKAGLIHAQFETIHPFPDGNGRIGRMLISLFLCNQGFLEDPILFLSSYFKRHQQQYYNHLAVYRQGHIFEWLDFYLDGVIEIAKEAIDIAYKLVVLLKHDMILMKNIGRRAGESSGKVLHNLYTQPIVNINTIKQWTGFTRVGAYKLIIRFINLGLLVPMKIDKQYGQCFAYQKYIDIFISDY